MCVRQVKGTGCACASWTPTEQQLQQAVRRRVERAREQLNSGRDVLHYIMPDLRLPDVTLVVALPFVTRQQLMQAVSTLSLDLNLLFLCKDDLFPPVRVDPVSATRTEEGRSVDGSSQDVEASSLLAWWQSDVCGHVTEDLPVDAMRTIVGRICGLMSVVSVWTTSRPRMEVRTVAQAIGESGRRLADIVLLPRQADLLAQPSLHRLWLTGPMGSGKTLMLQLKGRQWLREGKRVIVINVRTVSRGRPHGHVLEEGIRRETSHSGTGSVDRHDVALDEFQFENFQRELAARGPTENICFLVDEVLSGMSIIAQKLAEHYPDNPIWCVASYVTPIPNSFQHYRLRAVLRNPPSIQLMLKELDPNPRHKLVYTTHSAARGLPCDGPPIIFIEHSKHNIHVRHLDCQQCADELADIFETKLGLKLHPPAPTEVGHLSTNLTEASFEPSSQEIPKTVEAAQLSFRDILILLDLPISIYKYVADYHWEASVPELLHYMMYMGTSRFVTGLRKRGVPIRIVVDNTLKEIAIPSRDEVVITEINAVHSLERKVIVFVRGGPALTREEIAENISRYQTVQADPSPVHESGSDNQTEMSSSQMDNKITGKQLHLFVSLMHEVRDMLHPQMPTEFSSSPEEIKAIFHQLQGNNFAAGTQSFIGDKSCRKGFQGQLAPTTFRRPPEGLRSGMEYRGDLPMLPGLPHKETDEPQEASPAAQMESGYGEYVAEADSVFLVPDAMEDVGQQQSEVKRVQRAMEMLSEDDLDWDFFAASRCLSQYISILP